MAVINGTSGADSLVGSGAGTGDDTLRGLLGADTYSFSTGNGRDWVEESGDTSATILDMLQFVDRPASSFSYARSGTNLVILAGGLDQVTVAGHFDTARPANRIERLRDGANITYTLSTGLLGGNGSDILVGTTAGETMRGYDGNDILFGGAGNDSLYGNSGNDILNGGSGNDLLYGGGGNDTASYADATAAVNVSLAISAAQATGGAGTDTLNSIENLTGGAGGDALTGNASNNVLNGGAGDDTLAGGAGNDILDGGGGSDTASYASSTAAITVNLATAGGQVTGAGTDTLISIEKLVSGSGNDALTGNGSNNVLTSGLGDDTLTGGGGNDTLDGGAGNDVYRYVATSFSGSDVGAGQADTIVADAGDRIDFSASLEGILRIGGQTLAAQTASVAVGSVFNASNSVRLNSGHLQFDLNGDNLFTAALDFDIDLGQASVVTYDAAADQFRFASPTPNKKIALTFDDGPDPTYTPQVLSILEEWGVKATFFMTGEQIGWYQNQARDVFNAGHLIANHTFDHPDLTTLGDAEIRSQFQRTSDAIFNLTGSQPAYYRPPYGSYDERVESIAASMGLDNVLWTVDTNDWQQNGVDSIVQAALGLASDDGVILMHDAGGDRSQSVAALELIIPGLINQGFELVTVDQLGNLPVWA